MVVVTWNRKHLLQDALQSLMQQTARKEHEIIVIDNGSSDGTAEMVSRDFPEVSFIRNSENRGFCAANNQGIAAARGRYVALLNNDAAADPDWLAEMLAAAEENPRIGMIACKIVDWEDPRRIDKVGHVIFPDGQNRGRGMGEIDAGQYDTQEEVLWPDGCACLYRKAMLDQIGGFDEDFFAYGDDAELGLRARIAGWRCLYVPSSVVRHRRGSTLGRGNPDRVLLIERNRILLVFKLFPWSLLLLNPFFFAMRVLAGIVLAKGGGDLQDFPGWRRKFDLSKALLQGQWQALRLIPKMLNKRKDVERIAVLTAGDRWRLIFSHRASWHTLSGVAREVPS